ncbi:Ig-like domain-containing protein [Ferrimonas balearica]|uniref:Ig-like domain-containing protein n=1 Tax=Ferrimonas balearica TaxID=44012 RepID=UPI001C998CDB|nr:Ig-like domain-containing protein [Ferrimonas balearica]MBY5920669.1 Ig-like domain-containing protein [Ferrimonas balearica]MBY5996646.1 Ig-like domain-containing protein [Ferrimonas balearica]
MMGKLQRSTAGKAMHQLSRFWIFLFSLLLFGCDGSHSGFPSAGCGQPDNPCPAYLVALEVTPLNQTLDVGVTQPYLATAIYSDNRKADVTAEAIWQVANTDVANMDVSGLLTTLAVGQTAIRAEFDGMVNEAQLSVVDKPLQSLRITPVETMTLVGLTQSYQALALYLDGTEHPVTDVAQWTVADANVANVTAPGQIQTLAMGDTQVQVNWKGASQEARLVVLDAEPVALEVTPSGASMPLGTSLQMHSALVLADQQRIDVTNQVEWSLDDQYLQAVDDVNHPGLVTGIATGLGVVQTTLTLPKKTLSVVTGITVTDATVTALQLTPVNGIYPAGTTGTYTALAYYSDGQVMDVTREVTWSSSEPDVVQMVNAGSEAGDAVALQPGESLIQASFGGVDASTGVTITDAVLTAIQVSPPVATAPVGVRVAYQAIGVFSDGHIQELTQRISWQSSDTSVAEFSGSGAVSNQTLALKPGSTTISARFGGLEGEAEQTVTDAVLESLRVTPAQIELPAGVQSQLHAIARYTDGHEEPVSERASWSTEQPETIWLVAAGPNAGGIQGTSPGTATVQAAFGGLSATAAITISQATPVALTVTPAQASVPIGRTQPFQALLSFTDGSVQDVTQFSQWQSNQPTLATVGNRGGAAGLAQGHAAGEAAIQASYLGLNSNAKLTVTDAVAESLSVTPYRASALIGGQVAYSASAQFSDGSQRDVTAEVLWQSDSNAIAVVDSSGRATGLSAGSAGILATLPGSLLEADASLTVLSPTLSLVSLKVFPYRDSVFTGATLAFEAEAEFSDGSKQRVTDQVAWRSLSTNAAINTSGVAEGLMAGQATIEAALGYQGQRYQAQATLFVLEPTVQVRDFAITPYRASVLVAGTQPYQATLTLEDGTRMDVTDQVGWLADDAAIATLTQDGVATGHHEGNTPVRASFNLNGVLYQAPGELWVTDPNIAILSLQVRPGQSDLLLGSGVSLQALAQLEDGSEQNVSADVRWQSADPSIASVTPDGHVIANGVGETVITATRGYQGQLYQAQATIRVKAPDVQVLALDLSPNQMTILINDVVTLTATAVMDDGRRIDVSDQILWAIDDTNIAAHLGSAGKFLGLAEGETTIQAKYQYAGQSYLALANLKVLGPSVSVVSVNIEPALLKMPVGSSRQLFATAVFDDGSLVDVTNSAIWNSGNDNIAQVDSHGLVTGLKTGHTPINGAVNIGSWVNTAVSTNITDPNSTVTSVTYAPKNQTILQDGLLQLTATAIWVDGTEVDVTEDAVWEAFDPAIAVLTDLPGQVRGITEGVAAFRGKYTVGNKTYVGTIEVTVKGSAVTITRIRIEPEAPTIQVSTIKPLTATAELSDGTEVDVTHYAAWISSDNRVATFSGADGLAYGLEVGSATLSAQLNLSGVTYRGETTATVVDRAVTFLEIRPDSLALAVGDSAPLSAWLHYDDGSSDDVSPSVAWSSSDNGVVAVTSDGEATGIATGSATLTANFQGLVQDSISVSVGL